MKEAAILVLFQVIGFGIGLLIFVGIEILIREIMFKIRVSKQDLGMVDNPEDYQPYRMVDGEKQECEDDVAT